MKCLEVMYESLSKTFLKRACQQKFCEYNQVPLDGYLVTLSSNLDIILLLSFQLHRRHLAENEDDAHLARIVLVNFPQFPQKRPLPQQ